VCTAQLWDATCLHRIGRADCGTHSTKLLISSGTCLHVGKPTCLLPGRMHNDLLSSNHELWSGVLPCCCLQHAASEACRTCCQSQVSSCCCTPGRSATSVEEAHAAKPKAGHLASGLDTTSKPAQQVRCAPPPVQELVTTGGDAMNPASVCTVLHPEAATTAHRSTHARLQVL
jgi:hypothetical protein